MSKSQPINIQFFLTIPQTQTLHFQIQVNNSCSCLKLIQQIFFVLFDDDCKNYTDTFVLFSQQSYLKAVNMTNAVVNGQSYYGKIQKQKYLQMKNKSFSSKRRQNSKQNVKDNANRKEISQSPTKSSKNQANLQISTQNKKELTQTINNSVDKNNYNDNNKLKRTKLQKINRQQLSQPKNLKSQPQNNVNQKLHHPQPFQIQNNGTNNNLNGNTHQPIEQPRNTVPPNPDNSCCKLI